MSRVFLHRCSPLLTALAVTAMSSATAFGQTQSLFGNRGPASQIGTNLNGSRVGGATTFGTSLGTGLTGNAISGQTGGALPGTSGSGFVGRGNNTGRFVGNQRTGNQGAQSTATSQFGNRPGGNRRSTFGNRGMGSQAASRRTVIRPRHEIAFAYRPRSSSVIATGLQSHFRQLAQRRSGMKNVVVNLDEQGTAILRGEVDSLATKKLVAMMARLEPGIRSIRDELTVAKPMQPQE